MASGYEDLLVETDDRVLVITLNRPEARNALRTQLLRELSEAILEAERDRGIRCVLLTGGPDVFAAGADIREIEAQREDPAMREERQQFWSVVQQCTLPLVGAVNGYCLGGGNELAMMCDIVVAGHSAKFGQPEVKLGLIPGAGALQRLTSAIGKARAMRMILTGEPITASQALDWGLVSMVTPDEETLATARSLAKRIADSAPLSIWSAKEAIREAAEGHLDFELNGARFEAVLESEDAKEGIHAFLEKRAPVFRGT